MLDLFDSSGRPMMQLATSAWAKTIARRNFPCCMQCSSSVQERIVFFMGVVEIRKADA